MDDTISNSPTADDHVKEEQHVQLEVMDHVIPDATIKDTHVSVARVEDVVIPVIQVMSSNNKVLRLLLVLENRTVFVYLPQIIHRSILKSLKNAMEPSASNAI